MTAPLVIPPKWRLVTRLLVGAISALSTFCHVWIKMTKDAERVRPRRTLTESERYRSFLFIRDIVWFGFRHLRTLEKYPKMNRVLYHALPAFFSYRRSLHSQSSFLSTDVNVYAHFPDTMHQFVWKLPEGHPIHCSGKRWCLWVWHIGEVHRRDIPMSI